MKKIRPEEAIIKGISLKELLDNHKKWLNNEEGGKQLVLTGADLSYVSLEGTNLRGADLEGANLENANLENADLENVYLENAYLRNANLYNSNLENVNLKHANLENANLGNANLRGVYLENANLRNIKFYSTDLYKVQRKDLFEVGNIGSRNDTTHYFIEDNRIICGCFDNTLEEFEEKVKNTYSEDSREYTEYSIAIDTFKRYKEMYYKRRK